MDDLVKRLKEASCMSKEAADRIETLEAALSNAVNALDWCARTGRMSSREYSLMVQKWADEIREKVKNANP